MHPGRATLEDRLEMAAATGPALAAGAAALRDLGGEAVGRGRSDRHGLRRYRKAERSDERGSDQCLHVSACPLLSHAAGAKLVPLGEVAIVASAWRAVAEKIHPSQRADARS